MAEALIAGFHRMAHLVRPVPVGYDGFIWLHSDGFIWPHLAIG